MERLSGKAQLKYGTVNCLSTEYVSRPIFTAAGEEIVFGRAVDRIAAYEDTGLEPAEILTAKEQAEVACALNLLKEYQSVGSIEHFRELSQAEHGGRLVVMPCKRGQTVYFYVDGKMRKGDIYNIEVFSDGFVFHTENNGYYACFSDSDIGESVFFAREEAEEALAKKGRKANEN